jgi:hypothetical protein
MVNSVTVELSADEALVLFEWLAALDEEKFAGGEAEKRVLWRIEAALEKALVEPFTGDYAQRVEQARQRVLAAPSAPGEPGGRT